jgi:hypothetical protein
VTIQSIFAAGSIVQRAGESTDDLADRIIRKLERLGVIQTGNSQAFGPF